MKERHALRKLLDIPIISQLNWIASTRLKKEINLIYQALGDTITGIGVHNPAQPGAGATQV